MLLATVDKLVTKIAGECDRAAHRCMSVTRVLGPLLIPLLSGDFGPEAVNLGMIHKC